MVEKYGCSASGRNAKKDNPAFICKRPVVYEEKKIYESQIDWFFFRMIGGYPIFAIPMRC
jgi:hypothetical protein